MAEAHISITVNGEAKEVEASQTGVELFADDKNIIAVRLNGELRDLYTPLHDGDNVESVTLDSPDGTGIMRHSATHVMAQAVQEVRPDAKLGIGPVIENGFYYDFDVKDPFTPDDLKTIEKHMQRIIKSAQRFQRRVVSEEEALREEADEPYKIELIKDKEDALETEAAVDISHKELSMYDNLDREGNVVWSDLCRGPHLPNTRYIKAFKLERAAAAYWKGSEANPMLQRIYGVAFPTKDELKAYQTRMEEAAKRDHRKLGQEMDLFSFPDEIGPGLAVFHPKGAAIINAMEDYSREMHRKNHYSFVQTPHITKGGLYETSGHLQWYKDGMYPPMHLDEEKDENGNIVKQGFDYYLKPMNCPMHNLIFKSRQRSYRELPLRLFEFGVGGLILTVEHSEGEIRAGGGDIHVGLGIHARMFEDPQRFVEFIDCLPPAVRLAEQHRPVVVEGGKTAIVRPVGAACRVECLFEQILGLVEIAGGPLRCGRVDERGGPGLGAFEAHTQCQLDGALDDPLVLLMTPLRTVESHRLVEHGEQTRIVLRVLGVGHRLLQILVGLVFGGMRGEHRIESSKELVGVKAGARV